jgi:hypothetical protein
MAFFITVMMVALSLIHVDGNGNQGIGTWNAINPADVPANVVALAEQRLITRINSVHGIRLVEITSAESQIVTNTHYKLTMKFDVTSCPSSASPEDIKDASLCPQTSSVTCSVRVVHPRSSQTYQVYVSRCTP